MERGEVEEFPFLLESNECLVIEMLTGTIQRPLWNFRRAFCVFALLVESEGVNSESGSFNLVSRTGLFCFRGAQVFCGSNCIHYFNVVSDNSRSRWKNPLGRVHSESFHRVQINNSSSISHEIGQKTEEFLALERDSR